VTRSRCARLRLADMIGPAAAEALVAARGGTMVSIPVRHQAGSALAGVIGEGAMERLVELYGGTRIYVPVRDVLERRDRELRHMVASGTSLPAVALLFGISERRARQIVAAAK